MDCVRPGKRSKEEAEKRRQMVRPLYLEGMGPSQIASILGIHRNTAGRDIAYWRDRLQTCSVERFKEIKGGIKGASLDELPLIRKELWAMLKAIEDKKSLENHRMTLRILKTIFDCCCQELEELAKILKKTPSNDIPWEKFLEVMKEWKSIIDDFVPADKRAEAYKIMREIKLDEIGKQVRN